MGTMVTRYRIEDEVGRVLTEDGFFSYDSDDALEFRSEAAAIEEASSFTGTSVETFQRYSAVPDLITTRIFSIERSAA
ncbi:hypothetical protein [Ensifer sp. 1H6]|uniref:hypothetical protein n=1 Tax=Ensifer sp. 1H6 TaxID=1911585 RepID=UPI0009C61650|nr:hypothetical protein [Ensifer sp. 1H6]OMQ44721.1 hypothetical protein BKP54_09905 [Ensifer sp. 1H6]